MSQFKVDLQSLEALYETLLACAGELLNAQFAVGPGQLTSGELSVAESGVDAVNGIWGGLGGAANLGEFLSVFTIELKNTGSSVEQIAAVLQAAIKHYSQAETDVATGAQNLSTGAQS